MSTRHVRIIIWQVAVSVPVFGTELLVVVTNNGQNNQHVSGKVYFIREIP